MRRPLVPLGLSVLVASAPAAPVPTHLMPKADPLYFPTRVGAGWVYVTDTGKELRRGVTAVKDGDGGKVVTTADDTFGNADWLVSEKGLWMTGMAGRACDPPTLMLKLPHAAGATWQAAGCGGQKGAFAAHGPDEVEVPAGKFRAVRVEIEWNPNTKVTFWFAPGVGVVKNAGTIRMGLKSFTPGKE
ncbi:MAG: hypothetical protein C0501_21040 [Isosphaera sp.]|nr:hypothetical protein [Isosphaera sp.]